MNASAPIEFLQQSKARSEARRAELQQILDANKPEDKKTELTFGVSDNPGTGFTLGGGSAEEDRKRRETKKAKAELKKLEAADAFRRANPELAAKMAELDRQKALQAPVPSGIKRGTDPSQYAPPPVSSAIKASDPGGVVQRAEKATAASSAAPGTSQAVSKSVTDNRSYHLNATVEDGGFKDISNDPKVRAFIVSVFEEKFQQES